MSSLKTLIGKKDTGSRGRKLHRQEVLQQALGPLVVGRQREIGQPARDRLRLVARRHPVEVALGQRGGVEEIRLDEIRKSDVVHLGGADSEPAGFAARRS